MLSALYILFFTDDEQVDGLPIVFEEDTYSVGEQEGSIQVCAVAPASLAVSVAVNVEVIGGTAQGNSTQHQTMYL